MASTATGTERLGDLLIAEGLITREQLASALADQKATGHRLGYVLVKLGVIQELEVTKIIGRQYRMPAVDLSRFEVDPKILKMIPAEFAQKNIVLPLKREGRTLTIAMADPTNTGVLDDLKFITRYDLFPVIAGEYTLRSLIEKYYETQDQQLDTLLKDMEGLGDDVEVVKDVEDETATQAPDRRRPGGQADQRAADRGGPAGRQRHPHRALRARAPGPLPGGRRPARGHEAADPDARGADLADQDPVAAQHRRAAGAAGRPAQAQDGQPGHRLPGVDAAGALRREDRAPDSRQGQPDARPLQVRVRAQGRGRPLQGDPQSVRHGAGHRPDGLRQDDDAVLGAEPDQHDRDQHHDRGGPRRVQPDGDQPGPGAQPTSG